MNETMKKHDLVARAVTYAALAHANQSRKGTALPYIVHPAEAMAIASQITDKPEVLAAAVLHDVIEDAGETFDSLKERFGERVAELVLAASEDRDVTLPGDACWEERKRSTLDYLRACKDADILTVCFADKLANLRALRADCARYGEKLWERFHQKNKSLIAAYYYGLMQIFTCFSGCPHYEQYRELYREVFGTQPQTTL